MLSSFHKHLLLWLHPRAIKSRKGSLFSARHCHYDSQAHCFSRRENQISALVAWLQPLQPSWSPWVCNTLEKQTYIVPTSIIYAASCWFLFVWWPRWNASLPLLSSCPRLYSVVLGFSLGMLSKPCQGESNTFLESWMGRTKRNVLPG